MVLDLVPGGGARAAAERGRSYTLPIPHGAPADAVASRASREGGDRRHVRTARSISSTCSDSSATGCSSCSPTPTACAPRAARARAPRPLAGRTAALVFHKPSLRTRVSFTVGMHELGGDAVDLSAVEVTDTAARA